MSAWSRDKVAHPEFSQARDIPLMAGHVGALRTEKWKVFRVPSAPTG